MIDKKELISTYLQQFGSHYQISRLLNPTLRIDDEFISHFFEQVVDQYGETFAITEEEKTEIERKIKSQYCIFQDEGAALVGDYEHDFMWYANLQAQEDYDEYYWPRYKAHLENKNFSPAGIDTLENKTLPKLMSYIGNPNEDSPFSIRGLVVGDVQSGKTSNYLGLITKAADAGYKVIFLLTGTIESLRRQTQKRVEEGFIGYDSVNAEDVGVGRGSHTPKAFTSRDNDFTGKNDQNTTYRINDNASEPMIFVIKKNVSVLKKLYASLKNINTSSAVSQIAAPMIMIDDEADNASINTNKKDEDPTKINNYIRKILTLFARNTYMNQTCNIVELFSGIGSQAKALKNLGYTINALGTCEWDLHAFIAYDAIHSSTDIPADIDVLTKPELLEQLKGYTLSNSGKEKMDYKTLRTYSEPVLKRILTAIRRNNNFVDVSSLTGEQMPEDIDILTYSFPCQDLSNVGAFHGYNKGIDKDSGSRSSLLWQVGRILKEMYDEGKKLPRYLLMENVPTLLAERHRNNFKIWMQDLQNLGYLNYYYELNALLFGLPQNRPRLLMISVYVGENEVRKKQVEDFFRGKDSKKIVEEYRRSKYYKQQTVSDLLRINYKNKKLFAEAVDCTPNDTVSRQTIWKENPQIILEGGSLNPEIKFIRTITTKQDRNPNSGNLYFESGIEGKSHFRYLTPRECLLFMGFTDEDYRNIVKCNPEVHKGSVLFPRDKIIRMAGNSIPVKLLEGVFYQILLLDKKI